jgi:2-polyprenyl-6-methoxyphenol hydroxylase-like FAD-dependent oxidoreductase
MSEGWQIDASGRPAATCGDRRLIAAVGALRDTAPRESACFEALPEGWLFTAPVDRDRALVQLMIPASGEVPDLLRCAIAGSHLARALIADLHPDHWTWAAAPAFRDPSPSVQCLRVGDAAFAVDPICGDGTGHAIRGALLAAAVLNAVEEGGDPEALRAHYQRRLRYAFVSHLQACVEIYATLPQRSLWAPEVEQMSIALRAIDDEGLSGDSFCYRLVGTAIHRVSR